MPRTHRYPSAARNFIDAYANTNYLRPLRGEDLDRFYVERGVYSELKSLIGELEAGALADPPNNTKRQLLRERRLACERFQRYPARRSGTTGSRHPC